MNQKDTVLSIINDIRQYYAFGTPNLAQYHLGYNKIRIIIEDKIQSIINGTDFHEWHNILNEFTNISLGLRLNDLSSIQSPSLFLTIEHIDKSDEYASFKRSMVVVVSLLAKYFTIYYLDVLHPTTSSNTSSPFASASYARSIEDINDKDTINKAKSIIYNYLNGYVFLDHSIVLDAQVFGTIPYGMDQEEYYSDSSKSYPIGLFLFGAIEFFNNSIQVIR